MSEPNVEEPAPRPSRSVLLRGGVIRPDGRGFDEGFGEWMDMPADVADQWDPMLWHPLW